MISVLIIAKNSEETIAKTIKSVRDFVSEVIVVDGGSHDSTASISKKMGATVIENKFKNFADQRNLALSIAKEPWVFYIDADEQASSEFFDELSKKINKSQDSISAYYVYRKTFFLGKDWGFRDRVQRIFLKKNFKEWKGIVHETPEFSGKIGEIAIPILHHTHRNLTQMVSKTNEWSDYEADLRLKSKHPKMSSWRFFRVMLTGFAKSYFLESGWRNGTAGIIESIYQAFSMFITYAKLWEKQQED